MRREDLQAVQSPLKERYRDDPDAAVVTLRADADLNTVDVACSVETGRALVEAGLMTPMVDPAPYDLETVAGAHRAVASGNSRGKVVVRI